MIRFVISIALIVSANYASFAAARITLSNSDLTEIIRQTLEAELANHEVNYEDDDVSDLELLLKAKGGIVLSNVNIRRSIVPTVPRFKLLVLTGKDIQKKANQEGDFLYLKFHEIRVRRDRVMVTLVKQWARGRTSTTTYLSGGSATYQYRKVAAKWTRKFIRGRIV